MKSFRSLTIPEQLAAHLRHEVEEGLLHGLMPGVLRLERETGVNRKTVEAALRILEADGLLAAQGAGKRRRIALPAGGGAVRPQRFEILLSEATSRHVDYLVELQHSLAEAGHEACFCRNHLLAPGMNLARLQVLVNQSPADAWVVVGGSRQVLEWFSRQPVPAFALFGRNAGLPLAAAKPDKGPAFVAAVRRLVGLGHHRIALLTRRMRRLPVPGRAENAFLAELELLGIRTSSFNLPDWDDTRDGYHKLLTSLFRVTPPSALIIQEAFLYHAAQTFLARHGLKVPEDVSLLCSDNEPGFAWCVPPVSHIRWDPQPLIRRITRWAANVKKGRLDLRETLTHAEFVEGGTIGPVKRA